VGGEIGKIGMAAQPGEGVGGFLIPFFEVVIMAQPVWVLSVDLQTKTATFQTGLADAAKAARSSFNDIKAGADEMGHSVSGSMMESRHGVMLLGEEFGVRLPRALTTFIASIGPVGEAMAAAFPFLALIVGATLLLEHLSKLKEKGEELTASQAAFGHTAATVLNGLNDKLLEAGIRADELNNDHLAALNKQLQLIDHASLKELESAFDTLAKSADQTFAQLKTSWYQFGAGSTGAKHALDEFKQSYDKLMDKGDAAGAADLLAGTRKSAERVLDLQHQITAALSEKGTEGDFGDLSKVQALENELKKTGASYDTKAIQSQEMLVDSLRKTAEAQATVNATKAQDKENAVHSTQNKLDDDAAKVAAINAESQRKVDEEAERDREKAYRTAVENLQESERQKIEATKEGSAARLAAIDAAIKEEEGKGLQEEGFYRSLKNSRVETARQMDEELKKLGAEAGKEAAEHGEKMAELQLQALKQSDQLYLSAKRASIAERVAIEQAGATEEYDIQRDAAEKEIAALDQTANEYHNKLKALQDKEEELTRAHENKLAQIREQAEIASNNRILSAYTQFDDQIAKGLTSVITRQEKMSKMALSLADKMATGLIENALKAIIADDMTKPHDAGAAARRAFIAGEQALPGPAGVALGAVMGAGAFAAVMAFEDGGIVPGVGRGDIVPAMLEPGEGILSRAMMDNLKNNSGNDKSGGEVHIHHSHHYHVEALDAEGVDRVLTKHSDTFEKHLNNHARKLNR
jgi:hypothetical protein